MSPSRIASVQRRRDAGRTLAALAAAATVVVGLATATTQGAAAVGPGPIMQRSPLNVTADPLPTSQIDGVAWTQVIAGNIVYVGGSFAHARPSGVPLGGVGTVTRTNLM